MDAAQGKTVRILLTIFHIVRILVVVLLCLVILFLFNVTVCSGDYSFIHRDIPPLSVVCLILALGFSAKWRIVDLIVKLGASIVCLLAALDIAARV
jgi:hypothetical protein